MYAAANLAEEIQHDANDYGIKAHLGKVQEHVNSNGKLSPRFHFLKSLLDPRDYNKGQDLKDQ